MKPRSLSLVVAPVLAALLAASDASAVVRREGTWPSADRSVTVDVSGAPRAEAIRKLAEAAGWSVVVQAPPSDPVDIHVKNQPAGKVLELLLSDADYVAHRDGDLVSIQRASTGNGPSSTTVAAAPVVTPPVVPVAPVVPAAPAAPSPPAPPAPPSVAVPPAASASEPAPPSVGLRVNRGEDRVVTGGSLRIDKGDTVHDVAVFGGSVDIHGTVTGDVAVMGGTARIHDGARVLGDATAVGGALRLDPGAVVEGNAAVVGGMLDRAEGSRVGGTVTRAGKSNKKIAVGVGVTDGDSKSSGLSLGRVLREVSEAITRTALLFVFGAVLLALLTSRMEKMQAEVAARPMRSFALGVVGSIAAGALVVALCVTVIGIPFALVASLVGVFAGFAGLAAVLTTVGAAVLGHRTKNPYAHLAIGCVLYLVVGGIPFLGGLASAAAVLIGLGVLVATRGAGFFPGKDKDQAAYRSQPA